MRSRIRTARPGNHGRHMILIRIILFCLLLLVFFGVVRLIRGARGPKQIDHREGGNMVPCAYCALHVPEDQAIQEGEAWYCSEEHRKAAQQDDA